MKERKSACPCRAGVLALFTATLVSPYTVSQAIAMETVERTVTVKAPPKVVRNTIRKLRDGEPNKRKVVSKTDSKAIIEEEFESPIKIGNDHVKYEEHYSNARIDYKLLDADKLTRFEGAWTWEEKEPGVTELNLKTSLDSWMNLPFKKKFLRNEALKQINKRLAYVKEHSEQRSEKL